MRYVAQRLIIYVLVIYVGVTVLFILTRLLPTDPIDALLGQLASQGAVIDQAEYQQLRQSLSDAFGLDGSLLGQYWRYLQRGLLTFDFGPSFFAYPTPVSELILRALPWTAGLLLTATLIGWVLGNAVGLLAGTRPNSRLGKVFVGISVIIYPLPYYILALTLSILFSYTFNIFPLSTSVRGEYWSLEFFVSLIHSSTLPALSIVIVVFGWWVISMKALSSAVMEEEFVRFAQLKGVSRRRLSFHYVFRNALLPQVTILAVQIGLMFSGSILTEILFQYPGLGSLIFTAVVQGDFNLLMGTIQISIIAVATATLLVDLAYPLLDPRIRYR